MSNTIIGFFDDRNDAERARSQLLDMGLVESDIQIFSSDTSPMGASASSGMNSNLSSSNNLNDSDQSFTGRIKHFFTHLGDSNDNPDADYFAEGIRRGGYTISVIAGENDVDRACSILASCGAVDIDRRAEFYRENGFSKFDLNSAPYSTDEVQNERNRYSTWESQRYGNLNQNLSGSEANLSNQANSEQVIPVVQEEVNIGKRSVEKGRVRIYTRVSETPVNQDIRLRNENIEVDRVPVDRPVQAADMTAFREGEIELRETAEEPVISKEARVVEEVRVRTNADERVEHVQETARRTNVEVDRNSSQDLLSTDAKKKRTSKRDLNP